MPYNETTAQRMIEAVYVDGLPRESPLAFVHSEQFKDLCYDLVQFLQSRCGSTREVLCALTEVLMRCTEYKRGDHRTQKLVIRAAPIVKQLMAEGKQAQEITVIICGLITTLALYAADADET